jgi:hypothetical protein
MILMVNPNSPATDILGRDPGNALHRQSVQGEIPAVGQPDEQNQLVGRVHALDVEGRIGLGIALVLGLGQGLGKGQALVAHLGQDVVGRAVQDADDASDAVAGQGLLEGLDNGHGPGAAGFVIEAEPLLRGQGEQFRPRAASRALLAVTTCLPAESAL